MPFLLYATPSMPSQNSSSRSFLGHVVNDLLQYGDIKWRQTFDPKLFLAKVGDGRSIGRYKRDQIVSIQGDPAVAAFYIQNGKVKVTVVPELGKEAIIATLGTSKCFGEACLVGQPERAAAVSAMTTSVIVRWKELLSPA
jgi:CRP-like cAMP-binding protein